MKNEILLKAKDDRILITGLVTSFGIMALGTLLPAYIPVPLLAVAGFVGYGCYKYGKCGKKKELEQSPKAPEAPETAEKVSPEETKESEQAEMEHCLCWILKVASHTELFWYKRQRKFLRKKLW